MSCNLSTHASTAGIIRLACAVGAACLALAATGGFAGGRQALPPQVDRILARDTITVLVTDSGLGGLSVVAELERELRKAHPFAQVHLVFANALPDAEHTYNGMRSPEARADAFDRALEGMSRWYKPDLILIACNTLSVVFPHTRFAAAGRVPVIGIVDFGVAAVARRLRGDAGTSVLILGTPTTIEDGAHAKGLRAAGIGAARLVSQACPNLESEIQADPTGDLVRNLTQVYAGEAREKLGVRASGRIVAALCCSHYGYSRAIFEQVLSEELGGRVEIVDPNVEMTAGLLARCRKGRFARTRTDVRVVSRAELTDGERASIARALERVSPATAAALRAYQQKADLFDP